MAFGFGFNKQKVLSAAEKFVQQGKLQNAIAEYEKIRKHDNKDLTVANTIGDLYARLGDSAKAIECFKAVGDAYASQGFTVKGIAMYKKITKLQPSVDGSLKLAELYTQQGLFNDARAQYLQVADEFMKNGDQEQAVRLFQKVLEMDPENVPMRVKLAEAYIRLNKKKEAWEIFSAAAESLRTRGSLAAAEDILQRMLTLDPGNSYVLLMRGKAAVETEDAKSAIQYLEKVSDIDSHPDGLRDLLKAYLGTGDLAKSGPVAEKLLTVHNDAEGLFLLVDGAVRLGQYKQALEIYCKHGDRLLATDSSKLLANLHTLITHVQGDAEALEQLLGLLRKSGESTHVNEVAELLAHASVKNGNLERARELYEMLAASEPQNPMHAQNYQQVTERLQGGGTAAAERISAEEAALIVEELEATAPAVDQQYPDEIAVMVRSAVTDADLFLSYNLPDKALVPLLGALPQAPRDVRLNQRLAALHTRFERFTEAAVCCRTLESVYHDAGYPDEALRYGELATRYEETTGGDSAGELTPSVSASAEAVADPGTAAHEFHAVDPVTMTPEAHPEFSIESAPATFDGTQDVSSEWENALSVEGSAPEEKAPVAGYETSAQEAQVSAKKVAEKDAEISETVEEIRFYLEHYMTEQARTAFEKLESLTHDASVLEPLRTAIETRGNRPEEPEEEIAEINADDPATFEIELPTPELPAATAEPIAQAADLLAGYDHTHQEGHSTEVASSQNGSAHGQFHDPGVVHGEAGVEEPIHAEAATPKKNELSALVADLESSLGDSFPIPTPMEEEAPVPQHAAEPLPSWPGAMAAKQAAAVPQRVEPAAVAHAAKSSSPVMPPASVVTAGGGAAAAAPAMTYSPTPVRPLGTDAHAMHPTGGVDLTEMFGELKHELEEGEWKSEEDPETHYNLGVAFREMGLLDEAIAELQKVCSAIDRGHPFSQTVQTYTWLAQCFLDKGVPEAAIRWYEKALNIPGLDTEARVAINYELGSACETAQDKPGALRYFTYVYGANIDYRDVAERIHALKS